MGHKLLFCFAFALIGSPLAVASTDVAPSARERLPAEALQVVGKPYRFGGASPATGFDCSGLITHVFEKAWGLALPRRAREQSAIGESVSLAELQPGDLVFYNTRRQAFSHVGIYIGDGRFVHAPRPGARVRMENIEARYWRMRFNGARRLEPPTRLADNDSH